MAQLLKAAGNGNLEKVTELRDQWNYQNKKGETEDQLEIVAYLVSHGASLDFQDKKNRFTPLMLCLAQRPPRYLEIMQALLKGKPDLSIQDSGGQTVLHLAAQYEAEEAVELLLRAKPKVDATDAKNMTPLHIAAGKNNLSLVQLLVDRGHASVNTVDVKGNTPLHWACISNTEDLPSILQFLISKGARPVQNAVGNSPLHTEAMHCDTGAKWPTEAVEVLTKAFPQLESEKNKNGLTAQQMFEQGIDSEEPAETASEETTPSKGLQKRGRAAADEKTAEQYQESALAARAAAIARSKKKAAKQGDEGSSLLVKGVLAAIVLLLLSVLYSSLSA